MNEELVKAQPHLMNYASRLCRNRDERFDLVQDVNLKILRKIHLFQPGSNFIGWSMSILHNEFVNRVRLNKETTTLIDQEIVQELRLEKPALKCEIRAISHFGIREAMICRFKFGMTYKEIAESTGKPLGTIKSRINLGRKLIIQRYDRNN